MSMRLSGLISGMDTESVVHQLMQAHRLKNTKIENKVTTTEWKQDKWAALNTKLYSFYTGALSKIRMQGSFAVKKATSSNPSKVDITAGANAPEGTHQIKVKQLASSQFVTGSKLNKDVTSSTKLVDLGFSAEDGTTIHIDGTTKKNLEISNATTVGDFVNALKSAGLNANYDTVQQRFFISSKASGADNAFEITTTSSELVQGKNDIRDFLNYNSLSSANRGKIDKTLNQYKDGVSLDEVKEALLEIKHGQINDSINKYMADKDNIAAVTSEVRQRLEDGLLEGEELNEEELQVAIKDQLRQDAELAIFNEQKAVLGDDVNYEGDVFQITEQHLDSLIENMTEANGIPVNQTGKLENLGLGEFVKDAEGKLTIEGNDKAVLVNAADAEVIYNGAILTGSSNNFSVNGLTLNLKGVTADDEVITASVSNNTEAVYDMVKDFVNEYNALLKEMNGAYNATLARGFNPLTDEERDSMTDEQITKWEDKIKDSLLRRDNTLGGLINVMRSTLSQGVTVGGKSYSLSSFGITSPDYTERGILHISGDEDGATAGMKNKLMDALASNPDELMEVLSKLGNDLHSSLMDKMKSTTLSSALTVYNDKEMTKALNNYKSDLSKLETKLSQIEDRYFKQFAAMETAMARMNAQGAALSSMLGMNTNNQ